MCCAARARSSSNDAAVSRRRSAGAPALSADWVTPAQREAARTFVTYLRSRPVQERALSFGFRPADPAVPISTPDPQNPFVKLARYGLHAEVPPVAQPPDGAVVRNLLTLWSRLQQPR